MQYIKIDARMLQTYVRLKIDSKSIAQLAHVSSRINVTEHHQVVALVLEELHYIFDGESFRNLSF